MDIRKITREERIVASKIQSVAFNMGTDFTAYGEKNSENYFNVRGAFNDEGKMCSCFELIPYETYFNGKVVKLAGIGGVASLPEERGHGYVRSLFEKGFAEMRENGQWLSYLYPFSNAYYRQFGYEACMNKVLTTIPLTSFRQFPVCGQVEAYQPGGHGEEDIRRLYDDFAKHLNFMFLRNDQHWKDHIGKDPYKEKTYTYIWRDENGEAGSYITFNARTRVDQDYDLVVKDLVWKDGKGLTGMFGFLNGFTSQYKDFVWEAPEFLNLRILFREPYDIEAQIKSTGMARIVDAEEILRLRTAVAGEGAFVIGIRDDFVKWNNDAFEVEWSGGHTQVRRTTRKVDLDCDVRDFTRLISGYADLSDFFCSDSFRIHSNEETLRRYFTKSKLFINEGF